MKFTTAVMTLSLGVAVFAACNRNDEGPLAHVEQLNNLKGPTRDLVIELHEGTNMAAAPSPDGKQIAFTAQGALWVMPAGGGNATRITTWRLEPSHPVWAPNGKLIAFQNYTHDGNVHIWTIAPDGRNPTERTRGPGDDREPAWLPDSSALVFSSDRSGDRQSKIWQVNLKEKKLQRLTLGGGAESHPAVSPDGTRLAYADGGNIYILALGGTAAPVLAGPGAIPAWTPDGRALVVHDAAHQLALGGRQLTRGEDLFPFPVRFLPDGRMLYTADGQIRVRDAAAANPSDIAFSATMLVRRPVYQRVRERGFDDTRARPVLGISAPALSPDGASVAFIALNDVWAMRIGEAPRRLTHDTDRDASPQWTPDGSAVYFSTERANGGQFAIDQVHVATRARKRLAAVAGRSMATPRMAPGGDRIAYITLSGQLEVWDLAAGRPEVILPSVAVQVSAPSWTADGRRVMVVDNERINNRFREGYNKLRVIELATRQASFYAVAAPPRHISERDEGAAVLAPDGSRVAFIMDSVLHVMPVNRDGSPAGSASAITSEVADLPSWSGDSRSILYKSAHRLRLVSAAGGAARDVPVPLQWTQAAPAGTTLLRAGALWDGVSPVLQRDVDILLTGNRITWIRPRQPGAENSAGRIVDASAMTVMPGLWDAQVHPLTLYQGGQFGQVSALMLAYGVTSALSAGGPLHQGVELREALEAGNLVGPRLFIAPPLWEGNRLHHAFARSLRTLEVADMEVAKAKTMGVDFFKADARAPIPIMTRIAQAALDLGVPSGSDLLAPGAATGIGGAGRLASSGRMGYGWASSGSRGLAYQDAADVYGKGDMALVDTLHSAGALAALDPAILASERFILVPPAFVDELRRALPPTAQQLAAIRRDAGQQAKVMAGGTLVANGTDTPLAAPGIALHLNLRAAGMAMTAHQALQTVTINAARFAKVDNDLGSVEPGKLADLVLVRGNPLDDLRAAADVQYVIKNGKVVTLDEILAPFRMPVPLAASPARRPGQGRAAGLAGRR